MTGPVPGGRRRALMRLGILVFLVAAAAAAVLVFPLPPVGEIRSYFGRTGWWGPAAFIVAYAALTLAPVPKNVLSVAAGLIFGLGGGVAVVYAGAMLGSVAAFWLGRWLGREAVERFTGTRVEKVDRLLRRRGLAAMIGVRLVPVLPFTAINYAAGLTSLGWWQYFFGTAIGILPGTVSFVALGAFGLKPGWQLDLALGALGVLTLAGLVVAVRRRRTGKGADV
ncbi:TVP38/TMEM64 family protein [Paenarthrobacter sp. PH39-S1]|uniref:TVP38/TMEM64 family protein n=1 Tax=Paenarthrobacter sp. PH39-S1 TaxID=3046204 RepID=UPI0024B9FECC|nr:TVP38/TMEM64 family protein [Paenarthrobacter sp. PH39-S1]MDJ0358269.1 TVP38/TMEM64 family protein [Paenarthrobacter sp. PH39-S1]